MRVLAGGFAVCRAGCAAPLGAGRILAGFAGNGARLRKKPLTAATSGHIRPPHRRTRPCVGSLAFLRSVTRLPLARGKGTLRLFDIVGLDEGTCGRRLRSAVSSGCRVIGQIQAVPLSCRYGVRSGRWLNVLIRKHTSLYICAGTAPRDAGLPVRIPTRWLVGHKLESLILAQNERWRHA